MQDIKSSRKIRKFAKCKSVDRIMLKSAFKLFLIFCIYTAILVVLRLAFMLAYWRIFGTYGAGEWLAAVAHGLPMDCSIAGYLSVVPALLCVVECFTGSTRITERISYIWYAITGLLLAIVYVLDMVLYGYWGFRLDVMPFFYFSTSPEAALASAHWYELFLAFIAIAAISFAIFLALRSATARVKVIAANHRWLQALFMLIIAGLLIIPIRGGLGLAPMNLSRAYFSTDGRLNHTAINPAFSLMYSATHQNKDYDRFMFMSDEEAETALTEYKAVLRNSMPTDTAAVRLTTVEKPDVWLIILESFSSRLMSSAGGEAIAVGLDSIANSSLWFTNFYANSFRTDRALTSILSAFPALPTMSLLTNVEQAEKLPSIATSFGKQGYETNYIYGGDINFANLKAYLVGAGYGKIYSEKDFPSSLRTCKWGVADGPLFDFALNKSHAASPEFNVVQTSSSHEPFEVPYSNPAFDGTPAKNAFAYTDSCLTAFVNRLKATERWDRTLVVIVPDHLGAWPLDLPDAPERHHVPLIITGGALNPALIGVKNSNPGSQADIAATILESEVPEFPFSRNLVDSGSTGFAVFSEPEIVGLVSQSDTIVYNIATDTFSGSDNPLARKALKAYLQQQYQTAAQL